jgi:hypothetical protein
MVTSREDSNWVSIAEQLTIEMDQAKLAILVKRLCCALDDRQGPPTQDQTTRDIEQIVAVCSGSDYLIFGICSSMGSPGLETIISYPLKEHRVANLFQVAAKQSKGPRLVVEGVF